jgi:tripartite-type tricarboxylate transporter receptor subunit TctC
VETVANTPAAFAAIVRAELATWSKVVRAAGIKVE